MRQTKAFLVTTSLAALLVAGCFYDPDRSRIDTDLGTGGDADTDADLDAGGDGGGTPSEYGDVCHNDDNCIGEVGYCGKNPTTPDAPGACTKKDCIVGEPPDCPDGYTCCDCPAAPPMSTEQIVACIPNDQISATEQYCTCE